MNGVQHDRLQCSSTWGSILAWWSEGLSGISPATAIPLSAARMAEDGVLMIGAELEQAAPVLSFGDRGIGKRNLAFLRLDSRFNEESFRLFDIVDEMEVDKGCCLRCGFNGFTFKQKSSPPYRGHSKQTPWPDPNEHPSATRSRAALLLDGTLSLHHSLSTKILNLPSQKSTTTSSKKA